MKSFQKALSLWVGLTDTWNGSDYILNNICCLSTDSSSCGRL